MAKRKPKEREILSWIVRLKATVIKEIVCNDCTREQAEADPYSYASAHLEETELECTDYEVVSVEENA